VYRVMLWRVVLAVENWALSYRAGIRKIPIGNVSGSKRAHNYLYFSIFDSKECCANSRKNIQMALARFDILLANSE
jgi:hypothetical protein